jgi:hypothetical protein
MRRLVPVIALLITACGYKQEPFAEDYSTAICTLYSDCEVLQTVGGWEDMPTCLAEIKARVDPAADRCPDYDKKVGIDCVNGVNKMTCLDLTEDTFPQACVQVCPDGAARHSITAQNGIAADTGG